VLGDMTDVKPLQVCLRAGRRRLGPPCADDVALGQLASAPRARRSIPLVTDRQSQPTLERSAPRLLDLVDEVVAVDTSVEERRLRAFHLKTAFRRYVIGDVLYLDGDTLVIGRVGDVLELDADVAAATDFNHEAPWFPPQLRDSTSGLDGDTHFPITSTPACSSCVIRRPCASFPRSGAGAGSCWSVRGMPGDQEAFVSALYAMPVKWSRLPNAYNAIVVKRNYRFRESRVLHFFGSVDEQRGTLLEHLLQHLQQTGSFDAKAYWRCLKEGHPWGPAYEPWQLWRSRNYVRAVILKGRRMVARGLGRR